MKLSWSLFNDEYLLMSFIRQLRRKRISRSLIKELVRRGLLEKILEMIKEDKEFYEEYKDTIEFIESVVISLYVKEALGRKLPEKLARYPEIVNDWLREEYEEVIDVTEDERFVYKVVFDGDFRIILEWKL